MEFKRVLEAVEEFVEWHNKKTNGGGSDGHSNL